MLHALKEFQCRAVDSSSCNSCRCGVLPTTEEPSIQLSEWELGKERDPRMPWRLISDDACSISDKGLILLKSMPSISITASL